MMKTIINKSNDIYLDKSGGNMRRTNSFSKEFISLVDDIEKDQHNLQSSRQLNNLSKMEEDILGKTKEISTTAFYEKIKKQISSKGLKIPIHKIIAGKKDLQNLSTLTNLNEKEIKNSINKDDYLQIRNIEKITNENFEKIKKEIVGYENLKNIYLNLMNEKCLPFNEIFYHDNVGCLLPLAALIESKYNNEPTSIEEMKNKYNLFKKYIYNYRFIKGDGNCFYRAVIFRYFEIVILNKKIDLLKNIINEMKESFDSNEVRSRIRIKFDTILNTNYVLQLMLIILELLEEEKIQEAHYFYIKAINLIPNFDFGLILYFRFIFYNYIKKNENKLYLENFPIKIGNLLPSYYETNKGEFLFNKFYYCYLLSMFKDAEKIIIYLTPFVLGINLDIIIYDDNEDEIIKNINYNGTYEYDFLNDKIFVLNITGHYELLYTENDNIKYKNIFKHYINNYLGNALIQDYNKENELIKSTEINENKNLNNKNDIKKEKEENKSKENIFIYNSSTTHNNSNLYKSPIKNNNNRNIYKSPYNNKTTNINNREPINLSNEKQKNIMPNFKYKYSNIQNIDGQKTPCKSYVIDKDKIKLINKTEKKQSKNYNIIDEDSNLTDNKNINYRNKLINKSIGKEINQYIEEETYEYNINEKKNEDTDINIKIKKSINIKNMDFTKKINNNINMEKTNNNLNTDIQISNSQVFNPENDSTTNKPPKIQMSPPKKNEIKVEELECKEKFCHICCSQYNLRNEKEIIANICYDCLKKEIINQLYPIYLSYIQNAIDNISYDLAFKSNFSIFLKEKININDITISIENGIKELFNKNNNKINNLVKKESQEMDYLFNEIKGNFCILCLKELFCQNYKIPCGCNFCSIDDIKKYFHLKNKIQNNMHYVCVCSYEYSINDIYNLGLFFIKNKLYSLKYYVIDILNYYLSNQCCFCYISLDFIENIKIKYKDLEENLKNNLVLDDCSKLKHFICNTCLITYYKNETFFCNICNVSHVYCPK